MIQQPTELIGTTAAKLLFERVKGEVDSDRRNVVLRTQLLIRASWRFVALFMSSAWFSYVLLKGLELGKKQDRPREPSLAAGGSLGANRCGAPGRLHERPQVALPSLDRRLVGLLHFPSPARLSILEPYVLAKLDGLEIDIRPRRWVCPLRDARIGNEPEVLRTHARSRFPNLRPDGCSGRSAGSEPARL